MQKIPSFRFRLSAGVDWIEVLRWWLQVPGARQPASDEVQSWLRTATGNFEYKLGTAIGAVISSIWNRVRGELLEIPNLDEWRNATGLPWTAVWLRELLAWGSLEPFVSFMMGANRAVTRAEALSKFSDYTAWFNSRDPIAAQSNLYHPLRLREWADKSRSRTAPEIESAWNVAAETVGEFPPQSSAYPVIASVTADRVTWLDPAGYKLALSGHPNAAASIANRRRAWLWPSAGQVALGSW